MVIEDCYSCDNYALSRLEPPCAGCIQTIYTHWRPKETPTWKAYVESKVQEKMQSMYAAFKEVPDDCQQANFIRAQPGVPVPRTCPHCGLGKCPYGVSI